MSFSLVETKMISRRAVHAVMAYDGQYNDATLAAPVDVRVRSHNHLVRQSNMPGDGMSEILSAIDRLLFDRVTLAEEGLTLLSGGQVTITAWGNAVFELDTRDAYDGPVTEIWTVVRKS